MGHRLICLKAVSDGCEVEGSAWQHHSTLYFAQPSVTCEIHGYQESAELGDQWSSLCDVWCAPGTWQRPLHSSMIDTWPVDPAGDFLMRWSLKRIRGKINMGGATFPVAFTAQAKDKKQMLPNPLASSLSLPQIAWVSVLWWPQFHPCYKSCVKGHCTWNET